MGQWQTLNELDKQAQVKAKQSISLDPLEGADRTAELEDWLEEHQIINAWEVAPNLLGLGYDPKGLSDLSAQFAVPQVPALIEWLN